MTVRGTFDELSRFGVAGWAQDEADPKRRPIACVMAGDMPIAAALCNESRTDLSAAGIGDGCYGFTLSFPTPLADDLLPRIRVVVENVDLGPPASTFPQENFRLPGGLSVALAGEPGRGRDYSQHGEQQLILRYFEEHPAAPRYLLDIGAFDGVTGSNSRALLLRGWAGALVEPDPRTFARLAVLYAGRNDITCVRCAVGSEAGVRPMHFMTGPASTRTDIAWQFGQTSTLVDGKAEEVGATLGYRYMDHPVSVVTFADLLDWLHVAEVGFVSLDCEGLDLEIVRSIQTWRCKPWLICIECLDGSRQDFETAFDRAGYGVFGEVAVNILFRRMEVDGHSD